MLIIKVVFFFGRTCCSTSKILSEVQSVLSLSLSPRTQCVVPYSECVAEDHVARCVCKEEFHGNGTVSCIPVGFEAKNNS